MFTLSVPLFPRVSCPGDSRNYRLIFGIVPRCHKSTILNQSANVSLNAYVTMNHLSLSPIWFFFFCKHLGYMQRSQVPGAVQVYFDFHEGKGCVAHLLNLLISLEMRSCLWLVVRDAGNHVPSGSKTQGWWYKGWLVGGVWDKIES